MPVEIERKFLLKDETWRGFVSRSEHLRDGLVASTEGRKVRVRLYDARATLTIKSQQVHGTRDEFEYEIPRQDAIDLLTKHCGPHLLDKTRHYIPFRGLTWEIDVYEGILEGVVLAEVELPHAHTQLEMPSWAGDEVTGRPEFKKINMIRARLALLRGVS